MQTIAVIGANGRLGNQIALAFHSAGYRVIAITRSGIAAHLPAQIERRTADATDRQALIRATEGAQFIFNGLNPLYTQWAKLVLPLGANVMAAARAHGAVHLFPGNVYNHGETIPPVLKDDSPQEARTRKGAIRIELERRFREESSRSGTQTILLRAGDFFGGRVAGTWFDLVIAKKIANGIFTYPGPMDIPHAWAYLPDLAKAFVRLADEAGNLQPFETFQFPGHTMTGTELKNHCEAAIGQTLKQRGMPWPLLRLGGLVVPMLREVSEMAYLWRVAHSLDGSKLEALIGPVPKADPQAAVATALSDFGIDTSAAKSALPAAV
ncbi:NAD-dependent epimerase/dehydratase family protein [Hoeflea prorocentri]|uniref:NAD-dependent epimerase/dehydratase family protein n=1 Tax=Hoeflea prorocentri TaxID=1922333 RepID=A0A9X3ZJ26_9HYPH|nr:NAD-dependent epimerase/dehydratase family protein [Hoeflea prorocentri]MCY6383517.1 NAD-dependent epimerase/dehydratase family protein [Hoeflea prorocentri]MDA5401317.1 NAD-dependent epimerase/dehydratase family protein [Hoeflea prorocentri]